jgi:hypothetical protein
MSERSVLSWGRQIGGLRRNARSSVLHERDDPLADAHPLRNIVDGWRDASSHPLGIEFILLPSLTTTHAATAAHAATATAEMP